LLDDLFPRKESSTNSSVREEVSLKSMMESIKIPLVVALLLVFAASPVSCFVAPRSRRGSVSSRPLSLKPVDDQKLFAKSEEEVGPDIQKNFEEFGPFLIGDLRDDKLIQTAIDDAVGQQDEAEKMGIWAARGILLFVAVLWATNFASVKYLETLCFHPPCNHPPSEAALARFGVAAMVSVPLLIGQRRDVILAGFECGLWVALGYVTQAMALSSIPAGTCAFICSLTVVVVPLIAAFFGMPIKPINLASAVVALTGVGVLEGLIDVHAIMGAQPALAVDTSLAVIHSAATSSTVTEASGPIGNLAEMIGVTKGDILALGQPIGFGVSFMRIEHYVEKFKNVKNRVLTITAAECVVVGLVSLLWVLYDFHGTIPNFGYMVCVCPAFLGI
jgi:drug/metabolite transporter (DMT)-like permease